MVYDISSEGAVMGRERAKTDISFRDESISKRHARIYQDGGAWYLEDLGSSNGTYLDDQRVNGPVVLSPGAIFSLAQKRFEVVFADNGNGAGAVDDFPPLGVPSARSGGELPPPAGESMDNRFEPSGSDGDEAEAKGVGYFFIAVPKAIAYYMAAVPLMALNPLGTIRKGVDEQKLPAMGKMELIAYAIPAFVITSLVSALVGALVLMISGNFGAGLLSLLTAWIGPLIAIVVAVVVGFIFHPVFAWIIKFLKGESTPKSRTNFGVMSWVLNILFVIPSSLGALMGALGGLIGVAVVSVILGLIPAIFGVAVAGIMFVFYTRWFKLFNVASWFQLVLKIALGLNILLSVWGVVSTVLSGFSGGGGGTVANVANVDTSGMTDEQKAAVEAAQAMAKQAADNSGSVEDLQAKAAELAAKAAQNRDPKAVEEAQHAAEEMAKAAQKAAADAQAKGQEVKANDPVEDPPPPPPPPKHEDVAVKTRTPEPPPPPPPPAGMVAAAPPVGMSGKVEDDPVVRAKLNTRFAEFLRKRDAIEAAIDANPKLVKRKDLRDDYEELWKKTYKIRDKYGKKKGEPWKRSKIINRLKDQEVYEETRQHVDNLYNAIFGQ